MRRSVRCAVMAALVLGLSAGPALGDGWVREITPDPAANFSQLYAVACAAPGACEAVGPGLQAGWDGTAWTAQPDVGGPFAFLGAVSCPRAGACEAVGPGLSAHFDGRAWTAAALPAGLGFPAAVSCANGDTCLAVGTTGMRSTAATWTAAGWVVQTPPPVDLFDQLSGVACPMAGPCLAVGVGAGPGGEVPISGVFNGSAWSMQIALTPSGASSAALDSVACVSAADCVAVGQISLPDGSVLPLSEIWDGSAWRIVPTPAPAADEPARPADVFTRVSCTSAAFCLATGTRHTAAGRPLSFAERWDGSTWTVVAPPFGSTYAVPNGVSCPTANRCQAVGSTDPAAVPLLTLSAEYRR